LGTLSVLRLLVVKSFAQRAIALWAREKELRMVGSGSRIWIRYYEKRKSGGCMLATAGQFPARDLVWS